MANEPVRTILVVDDADDIREVLRRNLESEGFRVTTARDVAEAVSWLDAHEPDLVITDVRMPGATGLDLVRHVRDNRSDVEIVVITGFASVTGAVEAIKIGAEEYLAKPFTDRELFDVVQRALDKRDRRLAARSADRSPADSPPGLLGESAAIRSVFRFIEKCAASAANVLVTGESGTGKELVARAIHYQSARARGPFTAVNCAAIPDALLESELFGHVKGAFTGAVATRAGFFLTADGGTIFLDEIGEVSGTTQVKLLRVLQDKRVTMVGNDRPREVDVRIVAATNKDLEALVRQGSFREDLFYRLNVLSIVVPPLRDRSPDIPLLTEYFTRRFAAQLGRTAPRWTDRALAALAAYDWPGNVRELENIVQKTLVMSDSDAIDTADLPGALRFHAAGENRVGQSLAEVEAAHIRKTLEHCGGNRSEAARVLGIDRKTLREKLKRLQIED